MLEKERLISCVKKCILCFTNSAAPRGPSYSPICVLVRVVVLRRGTDASCYGTDDYSTSSGRGTNKLCNLYLDT